MTISWSVAMNAKTTQLGPRSLSLLPLLHFLRHEYQEKKTSISPSSKLESFDGEESSKKSFTIDITRSLHRLARSSTSDGG